MKTTLRALAVLALGVLLVILPGQTSLNAGPDTGGKAVTAFKVYGQIVNLDAGAGTIQLDVSAPDNLKAISPLTVAAKTHTKIKQCEESDAPLTIQFNDLKVGKMVKITGEMDGTAYVALSIIQY